MDLRIKGKKYEPEGKLVETITGKLAKLDKFFKGEARAQVLLERAVGGKQKGEIWRAELIVSEGKKRFMAESTKTKLANAVTTVLRDVTDELARAHTKALAESRKAARAKKVR